MTPYTTRRRRTLSLYAAVIEALDLPVSPQRLRTELFDKMVMAAGKLDGVVQHWDRWGRSAQDYAMAQRRFPSGDGLVEIAVIAVMFKVKIIVKDVRRGLYTFGLVNDADDQKTVILKR